MLPALLPRMHELNIRVFVAFFLYKIFRRKRSNPNYNILETHVSGNVMPAYIFDTNARMRLFVDFLLKLLKRKNTEETKYLKF